MFPLESREHEDARNNEHQDAGKHPCSLQIKMYLKISLSLDSHLRIFSSCFATYKTSSLSESRSCIAFPLGTALGLPLQQETQEACSNSPQLSKHRNLLIWENEKSRRKAFPMPLPGFMPRHDEDKLHTHTCKL